MRGRGAIILAIMYNVNCYWMPFSMTLIIDCRDDSTNGTSTLVTNADSVNMRTTVLCGIVELISVNLSVNIVSRPSLYLITFLFC